MRVRYVGVCGVIAASVVAVAGCGSGSVSTGPTGGSVTAGSSSVTSGAGGSSGAPVTGTNDGGQTTVGSTAPAGVAECRTDQLNVDRVGGGAAMGSVYFGLVFTNTGSTPCVMQGYPGVSYTDGPNGDPIGNPADRQSGTPVTAVRLDPGGKATAKVQAANGQSGYSTADCKPVQAQGIRIYPPDNKASLYISSPGTVCGSTTITVIHVQAVQPGEVHW